MRRGGMGMGMTDAQKSSAHKLAGYVEVILNSVQIKTDAVPDSIEITSNGDALVFYDREPGYDGDLYVMDRADMLISQHIKEFNRRQAFDRIVGLHLELAPEGDVVNHTVIPIIQTRFEKINGLTGESVE